MNVRVMGYRNWVRIAFPVLEDRAEVAYQRLQRRTKMTGEVEEEEADVNGFADMR